MNAASRVAGFFAIAIVAAFAAAAEPEPSWTKVGNAQWQARDSQGEVVFNDKLWIFGGWFDSYHAPPRDVWNSADGKTWELVTKEAPWKYSDLPMSLTFDKKMWVMGGWYNGRLPGHGSTNEVWSSTDGKDWKLEAEHAGWTPRLAGAVVEFKGRMWVLGGIENYYFGDEKSLKNDVWSSADGKTWTQATADAGWAPRAYHQAAVLGDKIYVFGGGNYVPKYQAFNDVWSSRDGVTWTKETDAAPWSPRLWFSAVTYRNRMWVIGGWSKTPNTNWGDVWYSEDGKAWSQLKTPSAWKERHELSAFVLKDKLWIAGGHAMPLSNEVWSINLSEAYLKGLWKN